VAEQPVYTSFEVPPSLLEQSIGEHFFEAAPTISLDLTRPETKQPLRATSLLDLQCAEGLLTNVGIENELVDGELLESGSAPSLTGRLYKTFALLEMLEFSPGMDQLVALLENN
jgi:hypothetical protein